MSTAPQSPLCAGTPVPLGSPSPSSRRDCPAPPAEMASLDSLASRDPQALQDPQALAE